MLIPDDLSDAFSWLYHKHRSLATYLMHVPLKTEIVEIAKDHPHSFKAHTFSTIIQFSSWFVERLGRDYKRVGFVLAHEIMHQMLGHCFVLWRWSSKGHVCGRVTSTPWLAHARPSIDTVCYPFDNGVAQKTLDYIVNDGLRSTGMNPPEDALIDGVAGDWLRIEEDVYVRLYEEMLQKQGIPPATHRTDPNNPSKASARTNRSKNSSGDDRTPGEGNGTSSSTTSAADAASAGQGNGDPSSNNGVGSGEGQSLCPDNGSPGCGGYDVTATDPNKARPDLEARRYNAFVKALAALTSNQRAGIGEGNIEKLLDRVHPEKMDWRDVVRPRYNHYLGGPKGVWGPFDASAMAMGRTMPGRVMRRAGFVVLVLDTSGSITRKMQAQFIQGNWDMFKQTMPRRLLILEIDAAVQRATEITSLTQLEAFLEPVKGSSAGLLGGGGTDMRKADRYLVEHELHPDLVIFFSDLYTPFPTSKGNAKDVTWVSTTSTIAPEEAGRTVRMWADA